MILNRSNFRAIAILSLLTVFMITTGCKREKKITGNEYIPRDVFVEVITDMHLMDGITNDMQYFRKFNPGDSIDMYGSIFEKHNVDRAMYQLTVEEYSKYPELLDKVYDEVMMNLNLLKDKIEEEED